MKHKKPPIPVMILLILIVIIGGYYGIKALSTNDTQPLLVSGTIEANVITISPELSGKVVEVFVDEGATVKSGDPLFRMDDSLLQGQRAVASAAVDTAKFAALSAAAALDTASSNYTLALNAARLEAIPSRTADWTSTALPGYALPAGYFSQKDLLAAAEAEVETALSQLRAAQEVLNTNLGVPASADFAASETRLLNAREAVLSAQDVLTRASLSTNTDLRDTAQSAYDSAYSELESAQSAYEGLQDSDAAQSVITARLDLAVTRERYESAQDRLLKLQTGEASPKLKAAQVAVHQAEVAAAQAETAVKQAEAQLALLDLQISKLSVTSPSAGTILTRSIQPGEMVSIASVAFKLGQLDDLSITVYVPENIYGTLALGQSASLTVDSFPGVFNAKIVHIADQAEFTPRNVQTVEGRKGTVFAVRLKIEDASSGRLKPGMPADITFNQ
jgi:HlyD family secretion protein